jgi:APA family basic amino acid/polyamine antiporter
MTPTLIPDPDPKHPGVLPRVLDRFDAIALVIGSIIGSGIFLKPTKVAEYLGQYGFGPILGVWILVGVVTLFGSLALAELAAMLPQAGGPYVYLREAYGRLPAFLWGWTEFWIIRTGSLGALSVATVTYLDKVTHLDLRIQEAIAIGIVLALSAINVVGTRWGAHVQNVTVVLKVSFVAIVIALPFVLGKADAQNLEPVWPSRTDGSFGSAFGLALIAVLWAYDGWINIGPVAEEIKDPQRNVPIALTIGTITVMFAYVAATLSYHVALSMSEVAASTGVAADMSKAVVADWGPDVIRFAPIFIAIGIMCSTFGAVNSNMLTGPRIYFAMARDGLLPKAVRNVHGRFQTPHNAIWIQAIWTVALILLAYDLADILRTLDAPPAWIAAVPPQDAFDTLTDFVIFGGQIFYAMAVGAVFVLRWKRPDLPRPYRTWGYPVVPAIYLFVFAYALWTLLRDRPIQTAAGSSLILAGVAFYFWARRRTQEEQATVAAN